MGFFFFFFSGAGRIIVLCDFNMSNGNPMPLLSSCMGHLLFWNVNLSFQILAFLLSVYDRRLVIDRKGDVRGAVSSFFIILNTSKIRLPACVCAWDKRGFNWALIWIILTKMRVAFQIFWGLFSVLLFCKNFFISVDLGERQISPRKRAVSLSLGWGICVLLSCFVTVFCSRWAKGSKNSWIAGLGPIKGIGGKNNRGDTEDGVIL